MFEYQEENVNHSLWVEKYRPIKLEDYVGNEHLKTKVEAYIEKNDIILINFASVSRVAVVENGIVSCVSNGDAYNTHKLMDDVIIHDMGKPISDILFYLIRSFIQSLMDRNIRTYFFFLDQRVDLGLTNEIVFKSNLGSGFIHWCIENDYQDLSPKGNVHYKLGSQKDIANKIIQLIGENDNQEKRMGNQ